MSALGQKQTFASQNSHVRFAGEFAERFRSPAYLGQTHAFNLIKPMIVATTATEPTPALGVTDWLE